MNPRERMLESCLKLARTYVKSQAQAEGILDGFGPKKFRDSDNDLKMIDDALAMPKAEVDEQKIVEAMRLIGSTHYPISTINEKVYYYMCKEDIAKTIKQATESGEVYKGEGR